MGLKCSWLQSASETAAPAVWDFYCCGATRLRSRLISVEYVTSLDFLRQYQPYFRYSDVCMYVCVYVCMYVCIYITAFASIPSNRNWGYFLFRAESHVFAGEEFECKCPMTCFSEYLNQFVELWNALKPLSMWKHFKSLRNGSNTLWNPVRKCRGKSILIVCVHYPHAGECATALRYRRVHALSCIMGNQGKIVKKQRGK